MPVITSGVGAVSRVVCDEGRLVKHSLHDHGHDLRKKSMTYPANILGIICCTSQIGGTEVVGIIG